jgi:hypothetical protein
MEAISAFFSQDTALGVLVGGLSGALLSFMARELLWERVLSERLLGTGALLKRWREKSLGPVGRQRLTTEATAALLRWTDQTEPLPSHPNPVWYSPEMGLATSIRSDGNASFDAPVLYLRVPARAVTDVAGTAANEWVLLWVARALDDLREKDPETAALILTAGNLGERSANPPLVYVNAADVAWRGEQEIRAALEDLLVRVRRLIPRSRVVLAGHFAPTLVEALVSDQKSRQSLLPALGAGSGPLTSVGAEYARHRSDADALLRNGLVLSSAGDVSARSIPQRLLRKRVVDICSQLPAHPSWSSIAMSGPPGSGKTQVARALADELASGHFVVLWLADQVTLLMLADLAEGSAPRNELLDQLAKAFVDVGPAEFGASAVSRLALQDALRRVLGAEPARVCFLIDDVDHRATARRALDQLVARRDRFAFRVVRVGRAPPAANVVGDDPWRIRVALKKWNRAEAAEILEAWIGATAAPERLLQEGWVSRQADFSLYTLRLIAEHLSSLDADPAVLTRRTISQQLQPIEESFVFSAEDARASAQTLERVRTLLEEGSSHEDVLKVISRQHRRDMIDILGELSWFSLFQSEDGWLFPSKLAAQYPGMFPDESAANEFLRLGAESHVFRLTKGAAVWTDKLVADGAAALYLGRRAKTADSAVVVEMIQRLHQSDSIEVLALALSAEVLVVVLKSLATAPHLAAVTEQILSPRLVEELRREPAWIERIAQYLIDLGRRIDVANIGFIAGSLARLCVEPKVERWVRDTVAGPDPSASIAMATLAYRDRRNFVSEMKAAGVPPARSLRAAAAIWPEDDSELLGEYLLDVPDEQGIAIWQRYCERCGPDFMARKSVELLRRASEPGARSARLAVLLEGSLRALATAPPRVKEVPFRDLSEALLRLAAEATNPAVQRLVPWLAAFVSGIVEASSKEWFYSMKGRHGLAMDPMEPALAAEILNGKVGRKVRLPTTAELTEAGITVTEPELVWDQLEGYRVGAKIEPARLVTWDGTSHGFVRVEEIGRRPVRWRPLVSFDLTGGGGS